MYVFDVQGTFSKFLANEYKLTFLVKLLDLVKWSNAWPNTWSNTWTNTRQNTWTNTWQNAWTNAWQNLLYAICLTKFVLTQICQYLANAWP